jgi:hypothetical protein
LDDKSRPTSHLSDTEKRNLIDLSRTAMGIFNDRRLKDELGVAYAQAIACTSHDLLTPLSGLILSISLLVDDVTVMDTLTDHQREVLMTASRWSQFMSAICKEALDNLRQDNRAAKLVSSIFKANEWKFRTLEEFILSLSQVRSRCLFLYLGCNRFVSPRANSMLTILSWFSSLQIMKPIPKQVPLIVEIDKSTTPVGLAMNDINVFQAALNLLTSACARTHRGLIRLRIHVDDRRLVFECTDSAPRPSDTDRRNIFVNTLHVTKFDDATLQAYHFPKTLGCALPESNFGDKPCADQDEGSIFWFCVPFVSQSTVVRSNDLFFSSIERDSLSAVNVGNEPPSDALSHEKVPFTTLFSRDAKASAQSPNSYTEPGRTQKILESSVMINPASKQVLVVDDSLVVRKSLARSQGNV